MDRARTEALAKWVADNPKHPLVPKARRRLVEAYLALADRSGVPAADAKLRPLRRVGPRRGGGLVQADGPVRAGAGA